MWQERLLQERADKVHFEHPEPVPAKEDPSRDFSRKVWTRHMGLGDVSL